MTVAEAERMLQLAAKTDPQLHGIVELALLIGIMPCDIPPITADALQTRRLTIPGGREVALGAASFAIAARLDLPYGAPGSLLMDARWRRLARVLNIKSTTINDAIVLALERECDTPVLMFAPEPEYDDEVPF